MELKIDSSPLMPPEETSYYVLHFLNPSSKTETLQKTVPYSTAQDILATSFKLPTISQKSPDSIYEFMRSNLSNFRIKYSSGAVTYSDLYKFIIDTTLTLLQDYLKVEVEISYSPDDSDLFLKLTTSELNLKIQAHLTNYSLQLNHHSADLPHTTISPYLNYTLQNSDSTSYESNFKHYDIHDNEISFPESSKISTSLFKFSDKLKLTYDLLSTVLDLDYMLHVQVIQNHFPPHNSYQVNKLRNEWAKSLRIWNTDSISAVRNYFGEEVALLYLCGKYYAMWIMIVAVIGMALYFSGGFAYEFDELTLSRTYYYYSGLGYAAFIMVSACVVDIKWFRLEQRLRHVWGISEQHQNSQQLPTYPGEYQQDSVTGKIKRFPTRSSINYFKILGCLLTSVFILLTLSINYFIFFSETSARLLSDRYKHLLLAMQMQILRIIHARLAFRVCYREGYETYQQYEKVVITRVALFNYISCYTPLIYILFFKGSIQGCESNDCISELTTMLFKVFLIKYKIYFLEKLLHFIIANCRKHSGDISSMVRAKVMKRYTNPLEDYIEVVSNLGLVVVFSAIYPLVPLFAFILNIFIIKIDEWFLCSEYQRPYPQPSSSVGVWTRITKLQAFTGVVINLWWIVERLSVKMQLDRFYVVIVAGGILLGVIYNVYAEFYNTPEDVETSIAWGQKIVNEKIGGRSLDSEIQKKVRGKYLGTIGNKVVLQDRSTTFLGVHDASLTSKIY